MRVPEHLSHKPIVGVDGYDRFDYMYEEDAKALSIGRSTWDDKDISAKVWRMKNGNWLRASEELPLYRVLDLSILIAALYSMNGNGKSITSMDEVIIDRAGLSDLESFLDKYKNYLEPRLEELKTLLGKKSDLKSNMIPVNSVRISYDSETPEHSGAGGMFQVTEAILETDFGELDVTDKVGSSFYNSEEEVLADLGLRDVDVEFI